MKETDAALIVFKQQQIIICKIFASLSFIGIYLYRSCGCFIGTDTEQLFQFPFFSRFDTLLSVR